MRFLLYFFLPIHLIAQVNYVDDIQPILAVHCMPCHSSGNIGPMALDSYESAASFASMIAFVTSENLMPPWKADYGYSNLDITEPLNEAKKSTIRKWIDDGLYENKTTTDSLTMHNVKEQYCIDGTHFRHQNIKNISKSSLLQRTYVVSENYIQQDDYKARQQVFVIPSNLESDIFVEKIVFEPGDSSIVLSANIYLDQSDRGLNLDKKDPKSGYANLGSIGFRTNNSVWHQWCPDNEQEAFKNYVKSIPARSNFILQIQYLPSASSKSDQSKFTIFYNEDKSNKPTLHSEYLINSSLLKNEFLVPKNSQQNCRAVYTFDYEAKITAIMPYGQFICTGWEIFIHHKNQRTTPLLKINDWQLMWKRQYGFEKLIQVQPGDQLIAIATYNNTEENLDIPILPTKIVYEGEGRFKEQFLVGIDYIKL